MLINNPKVCATLVSAVVFIAASVGQTDFQSAKEKGHTPPDKKAVAKDLAERLPEGACSRLGTARLRATCDSLAFSSDGKTLVGVDGGRLVRIWDAANGNLVETHLLAGRPYRSKWETRTDRSADGKTLLIREGPSLEMWDIPSGKRLDVRLPKDRKNIDSLVVSDDRRLLVIVESTDPEPIARIIEIAPVPGPGLPGGGALGALGGGMVPLGGLGNGGLGGFGGLANHVKQQKLFVWDTKTGKQRLLTTTAKFPPLAQSKLALRSPLVTPDGQRVVSASGQEMCVWDTAAGKLLWKVINVDVGELAFARNGRLLIATANGKEPWHVWDTEAGQLSKHYIPPPESFPGAYLLSVAPDGGKLLLVTRTDYVVWDLKEGKALHSWPAPDRGRNGVFSPDGQSAVTYDTVLRRWDIATGKQLYSDVSKLGHTGPVQRFQFTTDGKRLASVGEDHTIRIWDVANSKVLHTIDLGATFLSIWTLTPDNATLVGVDSLLTVYLWSISDGHLLNHYRLDEAQKLNIRLQPRDVCVTPDCKTLVVSAWPVCPEYSFYKYSFSFWDLKNGQLKRWGGDPGPKAYYRGDDALLSPDGRLVAYCGQLFDTRTGKVLLALPGEGQVNGHGIHVFSPDGRLLAAGWGNGVRVWELATMRPLIDLPLKWTHYRKGFSADGRLLAVADPDRFVVFDLAAGKIILERPAPEYLRQHGYFASGGIAFAPDGRTVATGHEDGTIFFWEVPPITNFAGELTEGEAAGLWKDLADESPAKGRAAIWRFQQDPKEAVRFLGTKYAAIKRPNAAAISALIRKLDSDQFDEREAASKQLKELGRAAEQVLRQALDDDPTSEQKRRLTQLLDFPEPDSAPPKGEDLRAVRVVAILEAIRTTPARQLLEAWASRIPGEWLQEEASLALTRLKRASP